MKLTADRVRSMLWYDPEIGVFVWDNPACHSLHAGDLAGSPHRQGYLQMKIDGRNYLAHRLAWLFHYGDWPEGSIDHINCDPTDNRICNLRLATQSENCANQPARKTNKCGFKGVHQRAGNRWRAQIMKNGKSHRLGTFDTAEQAHAAYCAAAKDIHGEFARIA